MDVADPTRTLHGAHESFAPSVDDAGCTAAESRGLFFVGLFKLSKAFFFIVVGAGALHLVHQNIGYLVMRIIDSLPIDPEGRVVSVVMDKADLINAHDLRRICVGAFIYAALCLVEGTGLLLRKPWAEYFTVILTTLGLPLELFELVRHATWFRAGALLANLAILVYLLWILKRHQRAELREHPGI